MDIVLVWVPPEANPETRNQVRQFIWEVRGKKRRNREVTEKGEKV
jgi:hypothetical protein